MKPQSKFASVFAVAAPRRSLSLRHAGVFVAAVVAAGGVQATAQTVTFQTNAGTQEATTLSMNPGSVLNITNNDVIIDTPDPVGTTTSASFAQIFGYVANGYNAGAWNGTSQAILSTTAAASGGLAGLAVVLNNSTTTNFSTFGGKSLTPGVGAGTGQALIMYTYLGDTNLDGKVTSADYSNIDNGYAFNLTGWFNGDFNYSGAVTSADYSIIDNSFAFQGAPIPQSAYTPLAAGLGSALATPEPGSVGLLLFGALGLISRRRRGAVNA